MPSFSIRSSEQVDTVCIRTVVAAMYSQCRFWLRQNSIPKPLSLATLVSRSQRRLALKHAREMSKAICVWQRIDHSSLAHQLSGTSSNSPGPFARQRHHLVVRLHLILDWRNSTCQITDEIIPAAPGHVL